MLDEPSFGLAPLVVAEIFRVLGEINRNEGVSLLIVEQNASLALDLADRAVLIETGRVALSGPSQAIPRRRCGAARLSRLLAAGDLKKLWASSSTSWLPEWRLAASTRSWRSRW